MKNLIIVESPSKAKKIESILGQDYKVIASYGHILELAKGSKFGMGIDFNNNFKITYHILNDKVNTLDQIMREANNSDNIYLATDDDREGTRIAFHIFEKIKDYNKNVKRALFKEITKKGIVEGIKNAGDINMNDVDSSEGRAILDRIVGFYSSPYLMKLYSKPLSAGRVQSVIASIIIEKEEEVKNFVPKEYWNLTADFKFNNDKFNTKYFYKITTQEQVDNLKDELKNDNKYFVEAVKAENRNEKPLAPLTTSKLQQVMAKKFGYTAEQTMKAAQALYETHGAITYMRTDSVRVSDDSVDAVRNYLSTNNIKTPKVPNVFKNKDSAQDAHEAIRPTDVNLTNPSFSTDENNVYNTIWKYFVASQMTDAVYSTLDIIISGSDILKFRISGKALKDKGYLALFNANESELDLPLLNKGDEVFIEKKSVTFDKKFTSPPARFSEFSLLKELDNKKIGRPSTWAEMLVKILKREYVKKEGDIYHPTELGAEINKILKKYFDFMDFSYSSKLEDKLDEIGNGKLDKAEMLKEFYDLFKKQIKQAYVDKGAIDCEICDHCLIEQEGQYGKYLKCINPSCKNRKKL